MAQAGRDAFPAGQVPLQQDLAVIPALEHPSLPRGSASGGGAVSGNVCPELPGEAELLPRASGKASSRPQPTPGDIQGDAVHAGALHLFPVPLASPEGMEKDPAAAWCVHHCQGVPIPVGQVLGTKQERSGDRQTDFGPGMG